MSGIRWWASPAFRHAFAADLLESGYDIRVQALLGHREVAATMIYLPVLNRGA